MVYISEKSVLKAGKMSKYEELRDFNNNLIVIVRHLGQSKTADLVGCSRYAVVNTYQKCSMEEPGNRVMDAITCILLSVSGFNVMADQGKVHNNAYSDSMPTSE